MHQKLVQEPILIMINNQKQSLHRGKSFKNKILLKRITKKP